MITIANRTDDFGKIMGEHQNDIIIYGAGTAGKEAYSYIGKVAAFCDKNFESIQNLNGIQVIGLEDLKKYKKKLYILVCIKDKQRIFEEVCEEFTKCEIDAVVFNFFDNIAFQRIPANTPYNVKTIQKPLRVRIVSYERSGWILSKYAFKLDENLRKLGVESDIASERDPYADINHHINYLGFKGLRTAKNDTVMVTHVDSIRKTELIKHQAEYAGMCICMSKEVMDKLMRYGVDYSRLCYINPGHDRTMPIKKYVLGITHKLHNDNRKRVNALLDICKEIDNQYFAFKIMGSGWEDIVADMREQGFEVEYHNDFNYDEYLKLMPSLDYYIFFGMDEGSGGFMDALDAGVKTIVTPQGYHLDAKGGVTHACETVSDFVETLNDIKREREQLVNSVQEWTWKNYAIKHLEIWNYMLQREPINKILCNKHVYKDGINSLLLEDVEA